MTTTMERMVEEARAKMIGTNATVTDGSRKVSLHTGRILAFRGDEVLVEGYGWVLVCYTR